MIEVNNLIKKFDDFYALNGVNMNVGEGDIYGLVGPNMWHLETYMGLWDQTVPGNQP